jgi:hypothetical protein
MRASSVLPRADLRRDESRRPGGGTPGAPARPGQGGAALMLALVLTALLLMLGSGLLTIATSERQIASNDRDGVQALHLAEAALERARRLLPRYAARDVLTNNPILGEWVAGAADGPGTYRAIVTNNVTPIGGLPRDDGVEVCGTTTCDTDGLVVITAVGTSQKSVRAIRAVVEPPPILRPPAALTMSNSEVHAQFDGDSFLISGLDRHIDGTAGRLPPQPAITTTGPGAADTIQQTLTTEQRTRLIGEGATPSVGAVATVPSIEALRQLALDLAARADRVFVDPGATTNDLCPVDGGGQITVFKGEPSADAVGGLDTAGDAILEGPGYGCGILIGTGRLTIRGSYRFDGVILLTGDGSELVLEGDATVLGAIYIANRTARNVERAGLIVRDRAQLHLSEESVLRAGRLLSARIRAWQEVRAPE